MAVVHFATWFISQPATLHERTVIIYIIQLEYIAMLFTAPYCFHLHFAWVAVSDIVYCKFWPWADSHNGSYRCKLSALVFSQFVYMICYSYGKKGCYMTGCLKKGFIAPIAAVAPVKMESIDSNFD